MVRWKREAPQSFIQPPPQAAARDARAPRLRQSIARASRPRQSIIRASHPRQSIARVSRPRQSIAKASRPRQSIARTPRPRQSTARAPCLHTARDVTQPHIPYQPYIRYHLRTPRSPSHQRPCRDPSGIRDRPFRERRSQRSTARTSIPTTSE
jgi:hypothetical protein